MIEYNTTNICLISPPFPHYEFNGFPPISLLYLDSYLNERGYTNTQIVDLNVTDKIPYADVYAISSTTAHISYVKEKLLPELKKINHISVVVIGGAHATALPEDCKEFDKVVVGDGEIALLQCLKDIELDRNNKKDKKVYIGEEITNLDEVPIPSRHKINIRDYEYRINGELSTLQMTSRGCPYNCYFCNNSAKKNKTVRFHSTKYVINEIQNIRSLGYNGIFINDDIFTIRNDLLDFEPYIKDISWQCQIRPDEKIKNIEKIGKMGCHRASFGLESGSQKILDIVNKKLSIKYVPEIVKECKKQNIKVHPLLIIGLPSESHETVQETIEFLRMIEPDSIGVSTFVPYPGTFVYNHIDEFDIKIEDNDYKKWYFRGGKKGYQCVVSTSELSSDEILQYRDQIDREFNNVRIC